MIKRIIKKFIGICKDFLSFLLKRFFIKRIINNSSYDNIVFYIISYNRLEYLKSTLEWAKKYNIKNIVIIDNNSDYKPLLDYYKNVQFKVIRMKKNYGHFVFYDNIKFFFKRNFSFYLLSDPDLYPINECPENFIEVFFKVMYENPDYSKVGFSLKIDDIPDDYYLKEEVIKWESRYYKDKKNLSGIDYYYADIDTTFALNSPGIFTKKTNIYKGIRTGYPYQARHLPWYETNVSEETNYYLNKKRTDVGNWNGDRKKDDIDSFIIRKDNEIKANIKND